MFPITITIKNAEELAAVQAALIDGTNPAPATPAKPARAAKTAAAAPLAPAAPAPTPAAPVVPPPTARAATADTAAPVGAAQIKAAGDDLSVLAELDRACAVAILGEFGVQKMTAMPASSIPEFHNKVKAAIAQRQPAAASPSLI